MSLLSPLRRVTSTGTYVPEVDGLRFVAIASVLVYHVHMLAAITSYFYTGTGVLGLLDRFIDNGGRGVSVFFAISGMILGLPFARQHLQSQPPVRLKSYFFRRITRLEPPYIVNLLVRAPVIMVVKHLSLPQVAAHLAVSLVYLDWLIYHSMPMIHPPSWSLAIEVQFYVLAPVLAWFLYRGEGWRRRGATLVAIAATSCVAAHLHGPKLHDTWQLSLVGCLQYFLAGLLAADVYLTLQPRLAKSILWDLAGLPLWVAIFVLPERLAFYLLPPIFVILFPAAFLGPLLNRFFRSAVVSTVGGMCYSIYLTHSLIYEIAFTVIGRILPGAAYWKLFLFGVGFIMPLALVAGTIFYVVIERPCMDKNWLYKLRNWLHRRMTIDDATA